MACGAETVLTIRSKLLRCSAIRASSLERMTSSAPSLRASPALPSDLVNAATCAPSAWASLSLDGGPDRSEEHTSELQSLMRISYAVFCLKKKKKKTINTHIKSKK